MQRESFVENYLKHLMVTSYCRGHPIYWDMTCSQWKYSIDNIPIAIEDRPCIRCGKLPTPEGYDACMGYIEGASSACCGHGVESGYVIRNDAV